MTDFETALAHSAASVEDALAAILADGGAATDLFPAMRQAVLSGGKRLRPFFVLTSAAIVGAPRDRAVRVAAAVELLHAYSLVHDDLPAMDDAPERRGQPTVHRVFGDATAILVGDALLTQAFAELAAPAVHPDPAVRCTLIADLAAAAGAHGMLQGQMLDLAAPSSECSRAAIEHLQSLKTGALLRFSCVAGAHLADHPAPPALVSALAEYAGAIGLAFQITDDLLDAEGDPAQLGKAVGQDAVGEKATFVALLGVDGARSEARRLADAAINHIGDLGAAAAILRDAAQFVISRRR